VTVGPERDHLAECCHAPERTALRQRTDQFVREQ
jgi:hypothetical protein